MRLFGCVIVMGENFVVGGYMLVGASDLGFVEGVLGLVVNCVGWRLEGFD